MTTSIRRLARPDRDGNRWRLQWRTDIMPAPAFEYFRTLADAEQAEERFHGYLDKLIALRKARAAPAGFVREVMP